MSKVKKELSYGKASAKLKNEVDYVIAQADMHNYYAKLIYAAHNGVFGLNEVVQTCSSCLRNRVAALRKWRTKKPTAATTLSEEQVTGQVIALLEGAGVTQDTPPHETLQAVRKLTAGDHHEQVLDALTNAETQLQTKIDTDNAMYSSSIEDWRKNVQALGLTEDSAPEDVEEAFQGLIDADGTSPEAANFYYGQMTEALGSLKAEAPAPTQEPVQNPPTTEARKEIADANAAKAASQLPTIELEDKSVITFTPNEGVEFGDGAKGIATTADGKKVKAGTYNTSGGDFLKVQVGGKATFEVNLAG